MKQRCQWCESNPINIKYHDEEWGTPVHDDRLLFEFLILEGAQAGLSWTTILKKRENYRKAFDNFDFNKIALYTDDDKERLLANEGIVRNRRKIDSTIRNAAVAIDIIKEFGSLDKYFWNYVDGKPIINSRKSLSEIPAKTELAEKMSKDLKKRGMNFVGPTICYAFMQAIGIVNDHTVDCYRYKELS